MKESELAFWQKTARHYTRSMDRSAPLYAAVCERIRPHLSRDMNVLDKTTPRLIQFHTLKNAVNPPFLGGFSVFGAMAA